MLSADKSILMVELLFMKRLILLTILLLISKSSLAEITGFLDSLPQKGKDFYVGGWACQKRLYQSINVHVYVKDKVNDNEVFAFKGLANKISNKVISKRCETTDIAHRFMLKIPDEVRRKYSGKEIVLRAAAGSAEKQATALLKKTNNNRYTYIIPAPWPIVSEIGKLNFHPLHYYGSENIEIITNGQVYNKTTKSKIADNTYSLGGAHAIASAGKGYFFAAGTAVIQRDKNNRLKKNAQGLFVKSRAGALVKFDTAEGITTDIYKENAAYPMFSPHDIIFNKMDNYYYYVDSHWFSHADYLVRFQYDGKAIINSEAVKLNSLYPKQTIYARSLSLYEPDKKQQKIIIGVSSHGEVILVTSFSESLSKANFEIMQVTNPKRQSIINKIGASGSYDTTGFVFNDVEYFKGYFYGTNYFSMTKCKSEGCADKYRLIRWKTWDDFEKDNVEDLSHLIEKNVYPII